MMNFRFLKNRLKKWNKITNWGNVISDLFVNVF